MKVLNIHERELEAPASRVGRLLDSLASEQDALWPLHAWPRMSFDRPVGVGAVGGHGPIRYIVEAYSPGKSVRFRFTAPRGFDGFHALEVESRDPASPHLRHTLQMTTHGLARLTWPLIFRPLHDALVEDALTTAEASLERSSRARPWSSWVRCLRWGLTLGKAPRQTPPGRSARTAAH